MSSDWNFSSVPKHDISMPRLCCSNTRLEQRGKIVWRGTDGQILNCLLLGCLHRQPNLDAGMTVTLARGTACYLPACMLFRHVRAASKLATFLSPLSLSNRQFFDWASPPYRAQKTSRNSSAKAESIIWFNIIQILFSRNFKKFFARKKAN